MIKKKVATIVLNRNLPEVTDSLCDFILKSSSDYCDLFVVESGSDEDKLSKYTTWWANWPEVRETGLRFCRGFNYGLIKLYEEGKFDQYKYFLLVVNDIEIKDTSFMSTLIDLMEKHKRVGILSPCSRNWGELQLIKQELMYFWKILPNIWMLRGDFIKDIISTNDVSYLDFLFDGNNFRGYFADVELIVKGYVNDWAAAITKEVFAEENENHLLTKADLIRTEPNEINLNLYISEGMMWMKKKYGFNSRWTFELYAKNMYELFFNSYPELKEYSVLL